MPASIITSDDLAEFKKELLEKIQELLESIMAENRPRNWIKSAEVMRILNISNTTLQNLRNTEKIPFYQVGGLIFYDLEEINDVLTGNKFGKNNSDL